MKTGFGLGRIALWKSVGGLKEWTQGVNFYF
jgi:hypothetical protein